MRTATIILVVVDLLTDLSLQCDAPNSWSRCLLKAIDTGMNILLCYLLINNGLACKNDDGVSAVRQGELSVRSIQKITISEYI